jgi:hypothetical protein
MRTQTCVRVGAPAPRRARGAVLSARLLRCVSVACSLSRWTVETKTESELLNIVTSPTYPRHRAVPHTRHTIDHQRVRVCFGARACVWVHACVCVRGCACVRAPPPRRLRSGSQSAEARAGGSGGSSTSPWSHPFAAPKTETPGCTAAAPNSVHNIQHVRARVRARPRSTAASGTGKPERSTCYCGALAGRSHGAADFQLRAHRPTDRPHGAI